MLRGHDNMVVGVALDKTHIITTTRDWSSGSSDSFGELQGAVYVWNAQTFALLRALPSHNHWPCGPLLLPGGRIISLACESVVVADVATGKVAERVTLPFRVWHVDVARDGRIAVCGPRSSALVFGTRERLAAIIRESATPVEHALVAVCHGRLDAPAAVFRAVDPVACAGSLREFFSAHELAMIAVRRGGVPAKTSFYFKEFSRTVEGGVLVEAWRTHGGENWWFLNLYICARKLRLSGRTFPVVQKCLAEAAGAGLIEGTEAVLTGMVLYNDLQQEIDVVHSAGIQICRLLVDLQDGYRSLRANQLRMQGEIEDLHEDGRKMAGELEVRRRQIGAVSTAFMRYREQRRAACLLTCALHFVPVVGVIIAESIADGFDGGSSIAELSKDMFGATLGASGEVGALRAAQVIEKAIDDTSERTLENMGDGQRRNLQHLVAEVGFRSVDECRGTFVEGKKRMKELDETEVAEELTLVADELSSIVNAAREHLAITVETVAEDESEPSYRTDSDVTNPGKGHTTETSREGASSASPDFEDLRRRGVSRDVVERLNEEDVAELIAAYLIGFSPRQGKLFERILQSLLTSLPTAGVFAGDFIVGTDPSIDLKDFAQDVSEQLERDGLLLKSTEKRLQSFITRLS